MEYFLSMEWLLRVFGVVLLAVGVLGITGRWVAWYWRSQRAVYLYLPFSLMFFLASFEPDLVKLPGAERWMVQGGYIVLFLCGMALATWPPAWIKPWWARQIEAQPKSVYLAMAEEVKEKKPWQSHLANPQALESWIQQIQRSHKKKK